ncbi:hypothetical protein NYV46_26925 [Escherichia coli]|nr:hypothetical protein [Escherichia coli]
MMHGKGRWLGKEQVMVPVLNIRDGELRDRWVLGVGCTKIHYARFWPGDFPAYVYSLSSGCQLAA